MMEALKFIAGVRLCLWGLQSAYPQKDVVPLLGVEPLVWVKPGDIRHYVPRTMEYKPLRKFNFVVGGDWDRGLPDYGSHYIYQVMADLCDERDDRNLVDSKAFQRLRRLVEEGTYTRHRDMRLDSDDRIIEYLHRYLSIRADMQKNGYRIASDPNDMEINLAICRDGRLVHFSHGKHRLALAQLLGLDKIVARIRIIHPVWFISRADRSGKSVRNNLLSAIETASLNGLVKEK